VLVSAKNHVHQIQKAEANAPACTRVGNTAYYMCTDCQQLFADKDGKIPLTDSVLLPATGHTDADGFAYDARSHWQSCLTCGEALAETKTPHDPVRSKCSVCDYETGTETAPTEAHNTEPSSKTVPWWVPVLVGLGAAGIGVGAVVILTRKK